MLRDEINCKLKRKTKKVLAVRAHANYNQKRKGNKANTCLGNFLHLLFTYFCTILYIALELELHNKSKQFNRIDNYFTY